MTKQLLAALLIAGISATARAEQFLFLCESTAFVKLDKDGVTQYDPEQFPMTISGNIISFGSTEVALTNEYDPDSINVSVDGRASFGENVLIRVAHLKQKGARRAIVYVAKCEGY